MSDKKDQQQERPNETPLRKSEDVHDYAKRQDTAILKVSNTLPPPPKPRGENDGDASK
jgi:hypothetical protein